MTRDCHARLASPCALVLALATSAVIGCSDPPSVDGPSSTGGSSGSGTSGTAGASGTATGGDAGSGPSGGGSGGTVGGAGSGAGGSGVSGAGAGGAGSGNGGTGATGGTGTAGAAGQNPGDRGTTEGTCARWSADRADLSEGTWSGSVSGCNAGDISPEGRANALRLINLYRWLADLAPVVTDPERDRLAQECALMMEANGQLSHEPPSSWTCYTDDGAEGAGSSNISGGPGVVSIDRYMIDSGNATTIGHRRWTLSNSLGPIGLGSTGTGASCFQNLRGTGNADKPWMAWPPPGIVPLEAFGPGGRTTIDDTGWTLQSDDINLAGATVSVSAGGSPLAVTVTQLQGGYGSRYAIRWTPDGWETQAGQTYAVSISGVSMAIEYEVTVVACGP